jgi:transcriptional regulator with XRE-family HTH domain
MCCAAARRAWVHRTCAPSARSQAEITLSGAAGYTLLCCAAGVTVCGQPPEWRVRGPPYTSGMQTSTVDLTRVALGPWLGAQVREGRRLIGLTQEELAARAETSQATIWRIEQNRGDHLDLQVIERVLKVLGLRASITVTDLALDDRRRQNDGVHAVVNGFGARQLDGLRWKTALEAQIGLEVPRGWIDLLGFREADRALLLDETKADLPDMGALQRSLAFYQRASWDVARGLGWEPASVTVVVLALDSQQMANRLRDNHDIVTQAFPGDVAMLEAWLADPKQQRPQGWTIAMVDPASRGEHWLRPPILGRSRRKAAYVDYADAARRLLRSS